MSVPFDPDWTVHPSEHLREFVEQWQTAPARALACASDGVLTEERAQEMLNGEGKAWSLVEAAAVGFALGPNPGFWQRLLSNHREAVEAGKTVVYAHPADGREEQT